MQVTVDSQGGRTALQVIGLTANLLRDWRPIWEGMIRPRPVGALKVRGAPDPYGLAQQGLGYVPFLEPKWTLEGSTADAFDGGGLNAYRDKAWQGYQSEPRYEAYKLGADGGTDVLLWKDAGDPLIDTLLTKSHPEHLESMTTTGMQWGTARWYAGRLHEGGFWQDWDEVRPEGRPIIPDREVAAEVGFRVAKAVQRVVVASAKAAGESPQGALAGMRQRPPLLGG